MSNSAVRLKIFPLKYDPFAKFIKLADLCTRQEF